MDLFLCGKSFTSTLIGMAVKDGLIDIEQPVKTYLPDFEGSDYGNVLVKHLLQMSSGIDWEEDYAGEDNTFMALFRAYADGNSLQIRQLLSSLKSVCPSGVRYNYSTGDTTVLGLILRAVLDKETLSAYLSRKVWSRLGMESDAYWVLDAMDGAEWGGGCISMTLCDEGRFGMFILNDAKIDGSSLLPDNWSTMAYQPDPNAPHLAYGSLYNEHNSPDYPFLYPLGYGYSWWCLPPTWTDWDELDSEAMWDDRAIVEPRKDFKHILNTYTAMGICGQYLHINPKENQVTVIWCVREDAEHDPMDFESFCFIEDITDYLSK